MKTDTPELLNSRYQWDGIIELYQGKYYAEVYDIIRGMVIELCGDTKPEITVILNDLRNRNP